MERTLDSMTIRWWENARKCGLSNTRTIRQCDPPVQNPRTDNSCAICGKKVR